MALTVSPLGYRSVSIVDPITGNQATVVAGVLQTSGSGGGGGGSVTQGTTPWVVSGQGTAGTAATGVVTVQGIASMTKLLVTPDSVALPANQSVNVSQINGVTATMGNGVSGTGVLRVTVASDSTGQIALAAGAATIGSLAANQSVNTAQINGVTPLMGNGVSGTGAQRVVVASDSTGQVALASRVAGGGTTMYHAVVPNNVTGVVVKNAAGAIYGITLANSSAAAGFLHLYNVTSAPTAGAGTIVKCLIAPGPGGGGGGGFVYSFPLGIPFVTGIAYTFTTGVADSDTGVPAASTYSIDIDYV